jgi:hypothetical protein
MNKDNLQIDVKKKENSKGPYITIKYEYNPSKKAILKLDASSGKNKKIVLMLDLEGEEIIYEGLPLKRNISTTYKIEGSIVTKSLRRVANEIRRNVDYCFSDYMKSDEIAFLYSQLFDIVKTIYKNY